MGLKGIPRKRRGEREAVLRRSLFLLTLLAAALAVSSGVAQAQTCRVLVPAPTTVRATGITETVGDITLQCRPNGFEPPAPMKIMLALNTDITSEIDESEFVAGERRVVLENVASIASLQTLDGVPLDVKDILGHAVLSFDGNSVEWSVPEGSQTGEDGLYALDLKGTGGADNTLSGFELKLKGLRANAAALGDGEDITVTAMVAGLASESGTVKVADVKTAFSVKVTKKSGRQCDAKTGVNILNASIEIQENFDDAFHPEVSGDTSATPPVLPEIEEGMTLELAFSHIPEGVTVKFDTGFIPGAGVYRSGQRQRINSDGVLAPRSPSCPARGRQAILGIAAAAVDNQRRDKLTLPVMFEWEAGAPELGDGMVMVSFDPVSETLPEGGDDNLYYMASGVSHTIVSVESCDVTLTFPFVTNQLGYDTGIAIANTSENSGSCAVKYYGSNAPASAGQRPPAHCGRKRYGLSRFRISSELPGLPHGGLHVFGRERLRLSHQGLRFGIS